MLEFISHTNNKTSSPSWRFSKEKGKLDGKIFHFFVSTKFILLLSRIENHGFYRLCRQVIKIE